MRELRVNYADEVPLEVLEAYCRRYLHSDKLVLAFS
jgi:hypothetical protein